MRGLLAAFALARRDLRGGLRGLWAALACLALGVAALSSVAGAGAAVQGGLVAEGRRLLGGDLEVATGARAMPPEARAWAEARGARLSASVEMRALVSGPSGRPLLVDLRAVDGAWPLVGEARIGGAPARGPLPGLGLDQAALARLGVSAGDVVRLGGREVRVQGVLDLLPDAPSGPVALAPRAVADLEAVGHLLGPGALVRHGMRVLLPPGAEPQAFFVAWRAAAGDGGWRLRLPAEAAPAARRLAAQAEAFLGIAAMATLLVAAVGVSAGVSAWAAGRRPLLAALRASGVARGPLALTLGLQVGAAGLLASLLGAALGAAAVWFAMPALSTLLAAPPDPSALALPALLAALAGLLTVAAGAAVPLGRALAVAPLALLRPEPVRAKAGRGAWALAGAAGVLLLWGALSATPLGIVLGAATAGAGTLLACAGLARLLARLGRRPPEAWSGAMRLGLAALSRPGAPTAALLGALAVGLAALATVAATGAQVRALVGEQIPARAPAFFVLDVQRDQAAPLAALAARIPGVEAPELVPSLRARIAAVAGVPAEQVRATPDTAWALRGDRGLTYAADMPPGTRLTAGRWWMPGEEGPPRVSFDARLAEGFGIKVGDTLTLNVLGRDIEVVVANLREIDWRSAGTNFTLIAAPGPFEGAPHGLIGTVRAAPEAEGAFLSALAAELPNVSAIPVREALAAVGALAERLEGGLSAVAALALAAGLLVVAAATAATREARLRDVVVLRALGAPATALRRAALVEFAAVGLVAGLLAALVGALASAAVALLLLDVVWTPAPGAIAATVAGGVAAAAVAGWAGAASVLRTPPARALRATP